MRFSLVFNSGLISDLWGLLEHGGVKVPARASEASLADAVDDC